MPQTACHAGCLAVAPPLFRCSRSFCAPGASATGATVMRLGDELTFTVTSDGILEVAGAGHSETLQPGPIGHVGTYNNAVVERELVNSLSAWRVHIPGGGSLTVLRTPTNAFPTGGTLSNFLSVSHSDLASESDMCTTPCSGASSLPYKWCSTMTEDKCLPGPFARMSNPLLPTVPSLCLHVRSHSSARQQSSLQR